MKVCLKGFFTILVVSVSILLATSSTYAITSSFTLITDPPSSENSAGRINLGDPFKFTVDGIITDIPQDGTLSHATYTFALSYSDGRQLRGIGAKPAILTVEYDKGRGGIFCNFLPADKPDWLIVSSLEIPCTIKDTSFSFVGTIDTNKIGADPNSAIPQRIKLFVKPSMSGSKVALTYFDVAPNKTAEANSCTDFQINALTDSQGNDVSAGVDSGQKINVVLSPFKDTAYNVHLDGVKGVRNNDNHDPRNFLYTCSGNSTCAIPFQIPIDANNNIIIVVEEMQNAPNPSGLVPEAAKDICSKTLKVKNVTPLPSGFALSTDSPTPTPVKTVPPPCIKGIVRIPTSNGEHRDEERGPKPPLKITGEEYLVKCELTGSAIGDLATNPREFITRFFGVLLSIAGTVALFIIIAAGYRLMTSQGKPETVQQAREQMTSAVVGLLFLMFSLVILEIIGVDILSLPGLCHSGQTYTNGKCQ